MNGDGLADIIVGAPFAETSEDYPTGASYVVFGRADAGTIDLGSLGDDGLEIAGTSADFASAEQGSSVSGAGDVNGDGFADLVVSTSTPPDVGSPTHDHEPVHIVFGKSDTETVDLEALGGNGVTVATDGFFLGDEVSGAGDVNGDGLADVIVGNWDSSQSYVIFSPETAPLSATYRGRARNGNAPQMAVGIAGDGSNDGTPDARVWIDFDNDSTAGEQASAHSVTLHRDRGSYAEAAVEAHWYIETDRTGWSNAELTFKYLDSERLTADDFPLQVYRADSPEGPYTPVPSLSRPLENKVTATTNAMGYFFIGTDPDYYDHLLDVITDDRLSCAYVGTDPEGYGVSGLAVPERAPTCGCTFDARLEYHSCGFAFNGFRVKREMALPGTEATNVMRWTLQSSDPDLQTLDITETDPTRTLTVRPAGFNPVVPDIVLEEVVPYYLRSGPPSSYAVRPPRLPASTRVGMLYQRSGRAIRAEFEIRFTE